MTTEPTVEQLRFPIGRFDTGAAPLDTAARARAITVVAETPVRMRAAVAGLSPEQLNTPYREGGWRVRDVVHHVSDSHMNAFVRFKLALTEDNPAIKTYREAEWARLADAGDTPIETSLDLLEALHARFDALLRSMGDVEFARTMHHPEWGDVDLDFMLRLYEWHGRHHPAHITGLRGRMGW